MLEYICIAKIGGFWRTWVARAREATLKANSTLQPPKAYISVKSKGKMNLIEANWEFTRITATAQAVEICRITNRMQDCQDVTQDILAFVSKRISTYNSQRAQPKTFINMLIKYAKKIILRKHYRALRKYGEITMENIEDYNERLYDDNENTMEKLKDWIDAMPDGEVKTICVQLFCEQIAPYNVGILHKKTKQEILDIARSAMAPIAYELGLVKDADSRWPGDCPGPPPA